MRRSNSRATPATRRKRSKRSWQTSSRLFKVVAGALASHADALAILVQQDGDGHKRAGEEREQGARPADAEVTICRSREERERRAEDGTNKVVAGEDARGVGGVCVCEVVQNDVLWFGGKTSVSMRW